MKRIVSALLAALLCLSFPAFSPVLAETQAAENASDSVARDISMQCVYNDIPAERSNLTDGTYAVYFESSVVQKFSTLRIVPPEGETVGALYIQWMYFPPVADIQIEDENGEWVTVAQGCGKYFAEYIPVPDIRQEFRIVDHDDNSQKIFIREMKVFTPGAAPDGVQLWQEPGDKVDLMLMVGHPDDEVLWFGGLLPYYGGELQKNVLVVCAAMNWSLRRLELLDCLWACGIRTHPIHSRLEDQYEVTRKEILSIWGEARVKKMYTEYIRKYKPDVLVLHDVKGEYGHPIHQAVSYLGRECAKLAADPSVYPEQVEAYGVWDIPKIYIHLYEENQITLDWNQPLKRFGGKTSLEVAQEAYTWHISQSEKSYAVLDHGKYDNSVFGLYRTLVGPDVEKNDFFEHIPPAE